MVKKTRSQAFENKLSVLRDASAQAESLQKTPNELIKHGLKVNNDGTRRNVTDLLAYPTISYDDLIAVWPELAALPAYAREHLETEALYAGYIDRQARDIAAFRRDEGLRLPANLNYSAIGGLSNEVCGKLLAAKPATLGQAARLEGITPGALTAVLAYLKKAS